MRTRIVVLALLTALAPSCKAVDCGPGTTERNGICAPANETVGTAICGPMTELRGGQCEPVMPTVCDPSTTRAELDPGTGMTTCIGTSGGCSAKIACPAPVDGTQTICGQIFDFETNLPFAAPDATGAACPAPATSGPCSLGIKAFDAAALAMNPGTTSPLTTGTVVIDDCGRYKVPEISQPAGPFVALAIDDASPGPGGTTNTVGVATVAKPNLATKDLDAFIVRGSTTTGWGAVPPLAMGIYAPVFRGHKTGTDLAAGVTVLFGPSSPPGYPTMPMAGRDYYFTGCPTNRTTLDPAAGATSTNGTALVSGATLAEVYAGTVTSLPAQCIWEVHPGAAIPGVVFIQVFRPTDIPGQTCPL